MPSFRVTMTVGMVRAGVDPKSVLPAAVEAGQVLATVEASGLAIIRGVPRIIVRFAADDAELAAQIASHVVVSTAQLAEVPLWRLTMQNAGRWNSVS